MLLKDSSQISENINVDLGLISKNSFCLFDVLLYIPVNSYGHVRALNVVRDVKQ